MSEQKPYINQKQKTMLEYLYACGEMLQSDLYDIVGRANYTIKLLNNLRKAGLVKIISGEGLRTVRLTLSGRKTAKELFPELVSFHKANAKQSNAKSVRYLTVRESRAYALAYSMGIRAPFYKNQQREQFIEKIHFRLAQEFRATRCNGAFGYKNRFCLVYSMDTSIVWWKKTEENFFNEMRRKLPKSDRCMAILTEDYENIMALYRNNLLDKKNRAYQGKEAAEEESKRKLFTASDAPFPSLYVICTENIKEAAALMRLALRDDLRAEVNRQIAEHCGIRLVGDADGFDEDGNLCILMPVLDLKRLPLEASSCRRILCLTEEMRDLLIQIVHDGVSVEVATLWVVSSKL